MTPSLPANLKDPSAKYQLIEISFARDSSGATLRAPAHASPRIRRAPRQFLSDALDLHRRHLPPPHANRFAQSHLHVHSVPSTKAHTVNLTTPRPLASGYSGETHLSERNLATGPRIPHVHKATRLGVANQTSISNMSFCQMCAGEVYAKFLYSFTLVALTYSTSRSKFFSVLAQAMFWRSAIVCHNS